MKKELISAYDFAKRKGVTNTAVYNRMKDEVDESGKVTKKAEIQTETIGRHRYIDWLKYQHITFDENAVNRSKKSA